MSENDFGFEQSPGCAQMSAFVQRMSSRLSDLRHGQGSLIRGTALMAMAEMGNRVSRIATAVVLGRALSTYEFGMIALIMTTYEFVRMLLNNGLGARIVQAHAEELDEVCGAVNRINWGGGVLMCLIQFAVAWPVQALFGADVAPMLVVLGLVHVIYPMGLIHSCLALREERYELIAGMLFFQITMDNIGTAAMAFAGYGVWAAVVPKVLIALIWVAVFRSRIGAVRSVAITSAKMWDVVNYGRRVMAAEALNTFRANADKLIVGRILGIDAVGLYSFAQNAGSGIAFGLASALGQAVLPFISKGHQNDDTISRFRSSVFAMSVVIMPVIAAQVILAPWYVPIVFSAKWTPAVPTIMLMCLGMLSRPLVVATSQFLRATGNVELEWKISWFNAILFMVAIIGGLPFGVNGVAASLSAVSVLPAIFFARMAISVAAEKSARPLSGRLAGARL